jgi:hypothetical protein
VRLDGHTGGGMEGGGGKLPSHEDALTVGIGDTPLVILQLPVVQKSVALVGNVSDISAPTRGSNGVGER